ncbi:Membrane protein PM19L [Linum grandiflorum]
MAMGRGLMSPMLIVNLVVLFIVLGLAAWSLDKYINGQQNHPHLGGNESTILMLLYALIAGAVGAASTLFGFIHLRSWTTRSLASASSLALFSWALAALSFGMVCKEVILGGHRGKRLQTLETLITVSFLSQLLYLVLLHAGMVNSRYGPSFRNAAHDPSTCNV